MQDLMELVAASFARHGIKCPAGESMTVSEQPISTAPAAGPRNADAGAQPAIEPAALPEHNYGRRLLSDPAP